MFPEVHKILQDIVRRRNWLRDEKRIKVLMLLGRIGVLLRGRGYTGNPTKNT